MIDNPRSPRVRAVAKLAKRSTRAVTGLFLVEGPQAVGEALANYPESLVDLFVTPATAERHVALIEGAAAVSLEPEIVSEQVLDAMADTVTPQGVLAVCRQISVSIETMLSGSPRLLAILEEVRDPGNAGTIIRAADAAGADGVVLTGQSVDAYSPKAVRSTTGSIFHLPIAQGLDLAATLDAVRAAGVQIYAADVKGDELPEVRDKLAMPTAWLFGNEARGLSDEWLQRVDHVVKVPIYGRAESLNLATAASVCLYESAFAQRS